MECHTLNRTIPFIFLSLLCLLASNPRSAQCEEYAIRLDHPKKVGDKQEFKIDYHETNKATIEVDGQKRLYSLRKEAFDLQLMMQAIGPPAPAQTFGAAAPGPG